MIKVLELIDGGFLGGGQTHILSIANNLDRNSYDITICASPAGEFKNIVLSRNYKFINIDLPKLYRRSKLNNLLKIVENNNFDLIHSHGGVAGVYARFLKKDLPLTKVIHTFHGIHYLNSKNIFRKYFSRIIERQLVPYTDKFICVSDHDFQIAVRNNITDKTKTVIIKNGIDTKRFLHKEKDKELSNRLGINNTDIIIGNISRFDYQKNQRFLIRSFKEVFKNYSNVKLLLVGDGTYLNDSKMLADNLGISNQTIFTGEIFDVENYYPLIDIFVFPSLWEGLSITLIEAMSSGRCIIASDITSNRELIRNNYNGILFSLHDQPGLVKIIDNLINDKIKRIKLSGNAEQEAKNFDEKEMIKKIESIYKQVS
jgi:glycosyltransferase involved in cell wall biosynthesis